jgi:hypothetical protein
VTISEINRKTNQVVRVSERVWEDGNILHAQWTASRHSYWCPNATHTLLSGHPVSSDVADDGRIVTFVQLEK